MLFTSFLCGKRAYALFHSPWYDITSIIVLQVFFSKKVKYILRAKGSATKCCGAPSICIFICCLYVSYINRLISVSRNRRSRCNRELYLWSTDHASGFCFETTPKGTISVHGTHSFPDIGSCLRSTWESVLSFDFISDWKLYHYLIVFFLMCKFAEYLKWKENVLLTPFQYLCYSKCVGAFWRGQNAWLYMDENASQSGCA